MSLYNDKSWLFSIFAIVSLFAGSSFLCIDDAAGMSAAKIQSYESVALNN